MDEHEITDDMPELEKLLAAVPEELHEGYAWVRAICAEANKALKNAERYRWLREQPNDTSAPRIDVVFWTVADESANNGEGLRMEELDAAIDALMTQTHNVELTGAGTASG